MIIQSRSAKGHLCRACGIFVEGRGKIIAVGTYYRDSNPLDCEREKEGSPSIDNALAQLVVEVGKEWPWLERKTENKKKRRGPSEISWTGSKRALNKPWPSWDFNHGGGGGGGSEEREGEEILTC